MTRYASETTVPVAKSKAEIEATVTKYGATAFMSMQGQGVAAILFEAHGRRVQFKLPLPRLSDFEYGLRHRRRVKLTTDQQQAAFEQACRQKWRALNLVVKAKLEAVESGITTFEDEFLAHIVLPDGKTIGDWMRPQLAAAYERGTMPPLLPSGDPT